MRLRGDELSEQRTLHNNGCVPEKFATAEHRRQHAGRVRYPEHDYA